MRAPPPEPTQPMPTAAAVPDHTSHIASRDGHRIYCEWFAPAAPRAAALLVHGYAEHCGRYRELAGVLRRAGLAALSFDVRGHGRSPGARGHVERFERYLDDFEAATAELAHRVGETAPRVVIAHSHGALIALRALTDPERDPQAFGAAVWSSPFLGLHRPVRGARAALGRLGALIAPGLVLANDLRVEDLTSDPDKLAARRADTLCHDVATAGWFAAAQSAQAYVAAHADRLAIPSLWLVAGRERVVDVGAIRQAAARASAPAVVHEIAEARHEVFNERGREAVFALVTGFINDKLAVR
jgi:alpha-beta hydrolase superfamily lysophospholipase